MLRSTPKTKEPLLLFVDSRGDVDGVSLDPRQYDEDERSIYQELLAQGAACARPFVQICTVLNGVIRNSEGDIISTDELPEALKSV